MTLQHPLRGLWALVVTVAGAAVFIRLFSFDFFVGHVAVYLIAMTPTLLLCDTLLKEPIANRLKGFSQPMQGILQVALAAVSAYAPYKLATHFAGSGLPSTTYYMIPVVPITMWQVFIFGGRHWARFLNSAWHISAAIWASSFALCWPVFFLFLDMTHFAGAPFFDPSIFTPGILNGDIGLTFIIANAVMIMGQAAFDFWPSNTLATVIGRRADSSTAIAIAASIVLVGAAALVYIGTQVLAFQVIAFQVQAVVSTVFGLFICLMIFETWPVQHIAQPLKGLLIVISAAVLSQLMFTLYGAAIVFYATSAQIDAARHAWIASAMLGVTFPFIVIYCNLMHRWPFTAQDLED